MTFLTRLPYAFYHLVPSDNFYCQTPLKNAKFDLFGSKKCQLANLFANRDWLIVTFLYKLRHAFSGNSKQLQRHMTANICRRFIPTRAFLGYFFLWMTSCFYTIGHMWCTETLTAEGCQSAGSNAQTAEGWSSVLQLRPSLRCLPLTDIPWP